MKKAFLAFAILISTLGLSLPQIALSASLRGGEIVSLDNIPNTPENYYLAGSNITVSDSVPGDLVVAGGFVVIAGDIEKDTLIAGGNIQMISNVKEDSRLTGGNIFVSGVTGNDLVVAGGSVALSPNSEVKKDALIASGNVQLNGKIMGNARITGKSVLIAGTIYGNADIMAEKIIFGENGHINGSLNYRSPKEMNIPKSAVTGEITHTPTKITINADNLRLALFAILSAFFFGKVISLIVAALIALWLVPKITNEIVETTLNNPKRNLWQGVVGALVIPALGVILSLSIIGFYAGLTLISVFALMTTVTWIVSGIAFGVWVEKTVRRSGVWQITWKSALGGVLVLQLIGLIPIIGWLIKALVFVVVFGALMATITAKFIQKDSPSTEA